METSLTHTCWASLSLLTARADSPATLSKSCSDKLALRQCISLLSGMTSLLIHPANAYINTMIISKSQFRNEACARAFGISGRMGSIANKEWSGGYYFHPFNVRTTGIEFAYSRSSRQAPSKPSDEFGKKTAPKGSNITAVWSAQTPLMNAASLANLFSKGGALLANSPEVLIQGRLQGWKEADPRGASKISRKEMWPAVAEVLSLLKISIPGIATYKELKLSEMLAERRLVKAEVTAEALKGWIPNHMDNFELKTL